MLLDNIHLHIAYSLSINQPHINSIEGSKSCKREDKEPRSSFAFVYSQLDLLHVKFFFLSIANHKAETQIMRPVCESGYWIEYSFI